MPEPIWRGVSSAHVQACNRNQSGAQAKLKKKKRRRRKKKTKLKREKRTFECFRCCVEAAPRPRTFLCALLSSSVCVCRWTLRFGVLRRATLKHSNTNNHASRRVSFKCVGNRGRRRREHDRRVGRRQPKQERRIEACVAGSVSLCSLARLVVAHLVFCACLFVVVSTYVSLDYAVK